jgi:hypothetical protein
LRIAIPTMSESRTSCNACSNWSFTLVRKWSTGLGLGPFGGLRRTVNCVPMVPKVGTIVWFRALYQIYVPFLSLQLFPYISPYMSHRFSIILFTVLLGALNVHQCHDRFGIAIYIQLFVYRNRCHQCLSVATDHEKSAC